MAMVIASTWYSRPTIPGIKPAAPKCSGQDQGDGHDGRGSPSWHSSGLLGGHMLLVDIMLHCFDNDDGIVDHDPDGQHESKHGPGIDRGPWE